MVRTISGQNFSLYDPDPLKNWLDYRIVGLSPYIISYALENAAKIMPDNAMIQGISVRKERITVTTPVNLDHISIPEKYILPKEDKIPSKTTVREKAVKIPPVYFFCSEPSDKRWLLPPSDFLYILQKFDSKQHTMEDFPHDLLEGILKTYDGIKERLKKPEHYSLFLPLSDLVDFLYILKELELKQKGIPWLKEYLNKMSSGLLPPSDSDFINIVDILKKIGLNQKNIPWLKEWLNECLNKMESYKEMDSSMLYIGSLKHNIRSLKAVSDSKVDIKTSENFSDCGFSFTYKKMNGEWTETGTSYWLICWLE